MTLVRLEPAALRVKHFTTEPLRSLNKIYACSYILRGWLYIFHLYLVAFIFIIHSFLYSFLVSGDFCCRRITFAKSLFPALYRQHVLIWIQTVGHSDSGPERCFKKVYFKASQQMTTKVLKSPSVQRVITFRLIEIIHVSTCVFVE